MRENIIDELTETWSNAEKCLVDHNDERALELKSEFTIKLEKYNLTTEELESLDDGITSMGGWRLKILTEKQPNRTDSFFYYDPIAQATAKDGTVFTSYPTGEVRLIIEDTEYDNDGRFGEGNFDNLTDNDLSDENNNVEWINNN